MPESFSESRLAGARRAAESAGARVCPLPLGYEEESAQQLAARWAELGLDAVFAYNDEYAMLLMRALQDAGVAVPADTAVIGADDSLIGRLLRPRLSTVRMELSMPQPLAETIDRMVQHPGGPPVHHDLLRTSAVHRESS